MGQDVKDGSRVCPLPPGPLKDLNRHLRPRTRFMAVGLSFILTTAGLVLYSSMRPLPNPMPLPPLEPIAPPSAVPGTPHGPIMIDGDVNFSATALLEDWPGDGSPGNPYIIDRLDIDLGGEVDGCIRISNTRVSFTISNCYLTNGLKSMGALAAIFLWNVSSGELVNNTCIDHHIGIHLCDSDFNTVANNICNNIGWCGIYLDESSSNTVMGNTINNNTHGIYLWHSNSNSVTNNTCSSSNGEGIHLLESDSNTVVNNVCNTNRIGIYLEDSYSNTVANNTCFSNYEHDIFEWYVPRGIFEPAVGLLFWLTVIILVGAGWRMAKLSRTVSNRGES